MGKSRAMTFDGHLVFGSRHKKWGEGQDGCTLCAPPKFSYTRDPECNAVYVTLSPAPVARTVEVGDLIHVDVDADGNPVGVEVL